MIVYKTFDEWSKAGFRILKGAKSSSKNDYGVPLFSYGQVKLREPYKNYIYGEIDDEAEHEFDGLYFDDRPY